MSASDIISRNEKKRTQERSNNSSGAKAIIRRNIENNARNIVFNELNLINEMQKTSQNNANKRFTYDKSGNRVVSYLPDTGSYLDKVKKEKNDYQEKSNYVQYILKEYGSNIADEDKKTITDYLNDSGKYYNELGKIAQSDHDYFSQWADEDAYKRDYDHYTYSQKYAKSTYADLQKAKTDIQERLRRDRRASSDELNRELYWLENHDTDAQFVDSMSNDDLTKFQNQNSADEKALQTERAELTRKKAKIESQANGRNVSRNTEYNTVVARIREIDKELETVGGSVLYYDDAGAVTVDDVLTMRENEGVLANINKDANTKLAYENALKASEEIKKLDYQIMGAETSRLRDLMAEKENKQAIIDEFNALGYDFNTLKHYEEWKSNREGYAQAQKDNEAYAKEHPVAATVHSILTAPLTPFEFAENLSEANRYGYSNIYDDKNIMQNQTYQSTVADMIDAKVMEKTDSEVLAWLASGAYSGVTSSAQSAMTAGACMLMFGPAGANISLAIMGTEAAASSYNNAIMNGSTNGEAILTATASGIAEALFEKVSLDKLIDIGKMYDVSSLSAFLKSVLKNSPAILAQGGIEASEEFFTEITNKLADEIINGDHSAYNTAIAKYKKMGYSDTDAKEIATKDAVLEVFEALYGGFIGGFGSGAGASVAQGSRAAVVATANTIATNDFYNHKGEVVIDRNNVSQLVEEAKSLGNSNKELANKAEAVNVGELDPKEAKKYAHQVGKLYKGVQKAQFDSLSKTSETAFRNVIKAELEKSGVADADATADILVKAMHNKGLTRAESQKFQSVNGRSILDKALGSAEFNKALDAEQKKQFTEGFDKFVNTESLAGRTLTDRKADLVSKAGYKSGAEKTFVDATDEVVDSLKVNSIKGDTITLDVKLGENNQVVAADELTFDNDYAVIISGLQSISKDFGLDVDSANRVLALWESYDGDSFDFYKTAQSGIMYGQYNQKKYFDNATFGNVPDNIRNELYNIGKKYRQKVTDTKAKAIKERSIPNGEVKVTFAEGVQYHKLTKSQKAQVDMAQIIARAFGFNLEVFRSPKVNGKSVGENGSFSPSANLMRLDIDAGTLDGKALILFTQGHELTHFIKAWSETAYKKFADFLIEKYTDKDVPLKSLVESKIENSKILAQSDKTGKHKELSYDEALEEVVCDACEDFLADPNIQQTILEIAKVDQSLADKIKNFIKNLINRLEKALRGLQGQSDAAAYTRSLDANDLQELKDLWTSALIDARENVLQAKARGGETQKNTTVEDDAKEQARFKGHTNIEKNGKKRYNKRSFYSSFDSLAMNWAYHPDTQVGDTNIFFRNNVAVLVEATENGFIEISSGKYEKVRSVYEQAHRETNRGLYANLSRIESRRGTDSWDLQYAEDGRYDVRDAQQNESQGFQTDSERDDEHLWSGDKREPVKRQDRDSLGRALSETQQSYFADSKIRDKNGNLMVMYHGSPKDDISSFRLSLGGAYFTANSDYAREYARDVGKVYEVYLNITKPFDTRNAECRAIFEKEFYGQWGNGAPLGDKGLPDWTDGDDLIDFLQEKGYDYDGLLLDEGGVPVGNGVKDRGISYVVFDRANQVKYTDNLNPTTNEDMKFAMRENVEETKDLVAVHNLTEEKLLKSLKLGGLPMPSIAIIKAREGHNAFGNVSLVFGRDTIDPRLLKSNKVYSRDAYTPTYPRVEYKASYSVADKVENRIDELLSGTDYKTAFGYLGLDYGNIDDSLNRNGGDVYEAYGRKEAIKLAYLRDKGVELKLPKKEKPLSYRFDNDIIVKFAEKYGEEKVIELINSSSSDKIDGLIPEIKALVENYYSEIVGKDMDWQIARNDVWDFLDNAIKYFRKGIIKETEVSPSTRQMIDDAIDENDYKNWVNELFSGIIEKEEIRNNKDLFTPSGNRRSFEALHDDVSLNNIIKAMKNKGEKGLTVLGGSITGASAIDFSSIKEIKSNSNKIKRVSEEEVENARKEFRDRLSEIALTLPKHSEAYTSVVDLICEAVAKCKTKSGIANYIRKEGEGWIDYSDYAIDDVWELVNDIRNSPVAYFEAKPQRAVMFNEVKAVIVPDNSSQELREQLNSMGVNVLTYESGNDESRINALNSIEDVKFQDRVTPEQDAEYLELAKNPEKNEARLREMVDAVARANGYTIHSYHGTRDKSFTEFKKELIGSRFSFDDKGFFFIDRKSIADDYAHSDFDAKAYGRVLDVFLKVKKPLMVNKSFCLKEGLGNPFRDDDAIGVWDAYSEFFKEEAENRKVDGIILDDGMSKMTVVFDPNQIKSADLVTYDDNGNIIPLFERFSEGNNDIRYQDRPYQPSLEDLGIDYKAENDKLKADVDRLNKLLKFQRTLTHGALFTKTSVDKAASLIMKEFGLHRGKSDLSEKLNALYTFVASSNDLTWDEFYDRASQVANWMIDSKPDQRYYKNPYASEVLKNIRERGITLNEKQKEEAAYYAGSLNAYRKSNIGNFRIVNEGGISLTELWEQLVKDYPGAFSQEDIEKGKKDTNLPSLIVEVIGTMRQTESVLEQMDRTQEVRKMVEKIYDTYWNVTTLHTLADKHQKEVNLLKGKHRAEMDALKEKGDENLKQAKERYREMLQKVREDKDAKMTAYKEHVAEQRHKSVEGRNKTATKNKIKRVVKELDKLLNKGNKKSNVKDGMQDMVKQALALSDLLLGDVISAETILSADIPDERLSKNESAMLKKWRDAVDSRAKFQAAIDNLEAKYGSSKPMETYEELVNSIAIANKHIKAAEKNLSELLERERKRLNSDSVKAAIESLSKAYEMLKESNVDYISSAYDENISDKLKNLVESLEGVNVKDMSMGDLQEVYTAYKMVLTTVRNANKLFVNGRKENFDEINALILQEINFHKEKRESKFETIDKALEGARNFTHNNLKPLYFFEELGSNALKRIFYDEIARAQRVYAMDWQESREYIENARKKHNYYSWDNNSQTIKLLDGRTVKFSMQELMSIYAYSKRPQADKHMSEGGFAFDNKAFFKDVKEDVDGKKVKTRELRSDAETPYRITEFELEKIKKLLGKERIEYVDDMQKYLSEDMANKGNSVTRVMYGIDIFNEKVYFPLKSSKDYKIPVSTTNAEFALKGSGFTKETEPAARNPIVLQGFDDVWAKHVNEMSTYHSLVLPIENMNKVLGYTEYIDTPNSLSTKEKIRKVYGGSALKYIENYIQDMNGGFSSNKGAQNFFAKGFSNFKKTAVGASMSTVIQQPTAVLRAMSMVKPKYFVGYETANHKALQDERLKYAPISIIKRIGGFDAGGNRSAVQALLSKEFEGIDKTKAFFKDKEYRKEKFDDAMMLGATFADEIGWNIIWNAVKNEVKDTTTFTPGSDEFFNECGNRFDEVVNATQVYDSVLSRSGYMRSNNELVKMSTAFMGEPSTSFNMLYNAVTQAKRGNISKNKAVGIVTSVYISVIAAAALKSLIYALRDDDDEESYVEKYMSALVNSLSEELFVHNMLPFLSDIATMFDGWEVERTDMVVFKDVVDAVNDLDSDSKSPYRKAEDLFGAFAGLFGIPLKNVSRTGREIYNMFANILDDNTAGEGDILDAIEETAENAFYGNIIVDKITGGYKGGNSASDVNVLLDKGNTAKAKETINELVADKVESGKTEKEAKASIKASVTSYWKDLYLQAYRNKDNAEMLRIRRILQATGLYDDVLTTCSNWIKGMKDETTDTGFTKW